VTNTTKKVLSFFTGVTVALMGEERGVYRVLFGKAEGKNHWEDLDIDGWIVLGWISRRSVVGI